MPYFDNAATTAQKPQAVADAVAGALASFGNPSRSAHRYALAAARAVEDAREEVAAFFGCADAARLAFTKNATEALNIAINSVDGHIVTSAMEHNSVLRPLYRRGNFSVAPLDAQGRLAAEDVFQLAEKTGAAAIVLASASNVTGNPAPVGEIGQYCREHGLLFIVDASQTAGAVPTDMEALCVDALCFTGHKSLYGPQGTGGICAGARFAPKPLLVGGSGSRSYSEEQPDFMPDLLEAGTLNGHGVAGLLAGLRYVRERGADAVWHAPVRLADKLRALVGDVSGIEFYGCFGMPGRTAVLALNLPGYSSGEVADLLDERYDIAVRPGAHCAPLLHRHFGTEKRGMVRFSFSCFNTEDEVERAAGALRELAAMRAV